MRIGTIKEIWRYPVKSMAGEQLDACSVGLNGIPGDRGWAIRDETAREITNGKHFPLLMQCSARYREAPANGSIPHVDMQFPGGLQLGSDVPDVNVRLTELLGKPVSLWPLQPASNTEHYRRRSKTARVFGRLARFRSFRAALPALTSLRRANAQLREAFSREPGEPLPDLSTLPPEIIEFTSPRGTYFDAFPIHLLTTASLEMMKRLNPAATWDVRRFRPNFLIETDPAIKDPIEVEWRGQKVRLGGVELKCEIPTVRCGMTIQAQAEFPKDPSILRTIVKDADQNLGIYASVTSAAEVRVGDVVEII
ncbi:MAG TPA: MOSC N-terminal beta barrel domain-containing protein [Pyrinomonadaceae bacterium]|nr:MOSC N-terminal beta barrel domain-containing protein [Pyrinomonadaceae bacterium]